MAEAQRICCVEDTHSKLRTAALELFCDNGYQATSLRDLAARLGVQAGSLYAHMQSKQSLLFELIEEVLEDLIADSEYSMRRATTFSAKLDCFIQVYVDYHLSQWRNLALLDREMASLSEQQRARITALKQDYATCLRNLLAFELQAVSLPEDILHTLTHSLLGMLQNLKQWYRGEQIMPKDRVVKQITLIIRGAVKALKTPAQI